MIWKSRQVVLKYAVCDRTSDCLPAKLSFWKRKRQELGMVLPLPVRGAVIKLYRKHEQPISLVLKTPQKTAAGATSTQRRLHGLF